MDAVVPEQEREPDLRATIGSEAGVSFRLKAAGLELDAPRAPWLGSKRVERVVVRHFVGRAAVMFSGERATHMIVLMPSDGTSEYGVGSFEIFGRFRVVERIDDATEAAARFGTFRTDG